MANKQQLEHEKYPQVFNREYPIKDMSIGYLKTQIEKIERTEINSEYLNDLRAEYKFKTTVKFVSLTTKTNRDFTIKSQIAVKFNTTTINKKEND